MSSRRGWGTLLFVLLFFVVTGFLSIVSADFHEDPFEGCGTINPNRMAPREELCLAVGGDSYINPYIFCATNANVCCPENAVPSGCRSNDDENAEQNEEVQPPTGYENSTQNCGSFTYDAGISRNVCLDSDRKLINNGQACSGRTTLCCVSGSCPACWQPSAGGASCQPCSSGTSTPQFDDEAECVESLTPPPIASSTTGEAGSYDICSSNLSGQAESLAACNSCFASQGIWTAVGCIEQDPQGLISKIIKIGVGILGGIFLLRVLSAAFTFTISQGDVKKTTEAKEMITESVIGVVFVLFSVTILQFIGSGVLKIPGFG